MGGFLTSMCFFSQSHYVGHDLCPHAADQYCLFPGCCQFKQDVQPLHLQERTSVVLGTLWKQKNKVPTYKCNLLLSYSE